MALEPGTRFASYEIAEPIGAGGMGEVYRATDTSLKRDVALKVLPQAFVEDADRLARFQREAEILASLNHPNIAQVYGLEKAEGQTAIVMELVDGPTLADRIEEGPIPPDEAMAIALQIVAALEAAHAKSIVHRDLKPANVKVRPDGTVKVLDFGISKPIDPSAISGGSPVATTPAVTQTGVILGTAAYMSPEQARGKFVDERTDIWAFGCLLFEMLTGQPAFGGEDVMLTLARVLDRDTDLSSMPSTISPAVRHTIKLCLEKDPAKRIADIRDVRLALGGAFETSDPRSAADAERSASGSSRYWTVATAVALAFALTIGFVHFREPPLAIPALHYTVPFPTDENGVTGLFFQTSMSPDGRAVAVSGVIPPRQGIYVRELDSPEWRFLPGSNVNSGMFWSADSRFIHFLADGRLQRVPRAGGPPETVAAVAPTTYFDSTGSASVSGAILLSLPTVSRGLLLVATEGAEPVELTTPEPAESHRFPYFLPDGQRFLYTAEDGSNEGIFIASIDDPEGRRLLADKSAAIYAPPVAGADVGYLIFAREGRLVAQALDDGSFALLGEPLVLADPVIHNDNDDLAAHVSSGGVLAYQGGRSRTIHSRIMRLSRSGELQSYLTEPRSPMQLSLSPDERMLALLIREPTADFGDVWLMDLERGLRNPLTDAGNVASNSNLVWSPDGDYIAYAGLREQREAIFIAPVDGSTEPVAILEGPIRMVVTDWTEDGYLVYTEYLAVAGMSAGSNGDIKYIALDSDRHAIGDPAVFRADRFNTSFGDISPDGRWIAYASDETGTYEIWIDAFPGGQRKQRISEAQSAGSDTQQPRWNADGTELYYLTGSAAEMTLMAAVLEQTDPDGDLRLARLTPVLEAPINSFAPFQGTTLYALPRDGETFIVNAVDPAFGPPYLNIVHNWREVFDATHGN